MHRRQFAVFCLITTLGVSTAHAQVDERRRNQGGGGGPPPGVFQVVAVDTYARSVQLKAADGTLSTVRVPDGVYDLGKLNPGDRIQVNFYVPDAMNPGLRAAAIWPAGR